MNGPLYMQTVNNKIIVGRPKRKGDGTLKDLARWLFENQTGFSFNLIALLFMTHFCMPKARPYTSKFFTLSYFNPNTGKYAAGFDDVYFMTFCIILLTGLRAGSMEHIFAPLGKVWGIAKRKDATRFSEQAWLFIYSGILWPLGLYIYYNSAYFLNMAELWTNWPDRELHALMKGYMLLQWAWWIQQVLVIHLESRRKDHWQMLTHHFVTIALISSAYYYHQTRVGNLILILMDVVDLFLPLAKCLKYLGFTTLCDYVFGLFMISWFIPRHIFFLQTCWSIYSDLPKALAGDCYKGIMDKLEGPFPKPAGWSHVLEPFTNPEGTVCFDDTIRYSFLFFLLALQVIILMWFVVIIRVATKVLKGGSAEDVRSDDEDEEEEEELEYEQVQQPAQPVKEEVGVEDLDLKGWERRAGVKRNTASTTSTTGVSLPGHSARKELLNRIGCEKQID
ncbi:putative longevity-assurance protein [Bombardia bombarda]|uniref:Longevity-assurance protein n=1 Tax=Bombardia bombarda TaxID=252184 RepID=A0AA39WU90_9PEZI|nr:putative longevity-assurance protein [Bombardia bombarda]